jgi:hypothetical protein
MRSVEGRRLEAMERLRNPLITTGELTTTVSTHSRDALDTPRERAAHQHIRYSQIQELGRATVPDQGIVFDKHNRLRDVKPGQHLMKEESIPVSGGD